jgi:16S rRNA (guanine527-N7)-methyltransferase
MDRRQQTAKMRSKLSTAIKTHQGSFGLDMAEETLARLDAYYALLLEHNPILHLIGPMDAEEFAIRHVLESLTMLRYLPENARFADVGSGGGLPAIPCLIARYDLRAVLIETKEKKTRFLQAAIQKLRVSDRTQVLTCQFHEADIVGCSIVTCRALDKFTQKLAHLLKWAGRREMILFGGPNLRNALQQASVKFDEVLLPLSKQRYLFHLTGRVDT